VAGVDMSRYTSLYDNVDLEDLTLALDRVLHSDPYRGLLSTGFNAIIHSTGALVIRNWVRRCSPKPSPLRRVIHLAGANFGSGWASVGESDLVKWGRLLFAGGTERGIAVLEGLELGSSFAIDLHRYFLEDGNNMLRDYGVMEFNIVGSQVSLGAAVHLPIRYGKEDGSDGVVRVCASNLNHHYIEIGPTPDADRDWEAAIAHADQEADRLATIGRKLDDVTRAPGEAPGEGAAAEDEAARGGIDATYYGVLRDCRPADSMDSAAALSVASPGPFTHVRARTPFAIPYRTSHSGDDIGIVHGEQTKSEVDDLIDHAFACTRDAGGAVDLAAYEAAARYYDGATSRTYETVLSQAHKDWFDRVLGEFIKPIQEQWQNPPGQYDKHAQVIVRVRDHHGRPVRNCSVSFNSFGGGAEPHTMVNELIEDTHVNAGARGNCTFYLRTDAYQVRDGAAGWFPRIPDIKGLDLEIDSIDGSEDRIRFVPLRLRISEDQLSAWIRPHRTTILDVQLLRLPAARTFLVVRAGQG
jgi:hypothetical protein